MSKIGNLSDALNFRERHFIYVFATQVDLKQLVKSRRVRTSFATLHFVFVAMSAFVLSNDNVIIQLELMVRQRVPARSVLTQCATECRWRRTIKATVSVLSSTAEMDTGHKDVRIYQNAKASRAENAPSKGCSTFSSSCVVPERIQ